jgi:hypothetical protein
MSAGLQIVLLGGVFSITKNVCCVIRIQEEETIWFLVSFLGNSGLSCYKNLDSRSLLPNRLSRPLKFGGPDLMSSSLIRIGRVSIL